MREQSWLSRTYSCSQKLNKLAFGGTKHQLFFIVFQYTAPYFTDGGWRRKFHLVKSATLQLCSLKCWTNDQLLPELATGTVADSYLYDLCPVWGPSIWPGEFPEISVRFPDCIWRLRKIVPRSFGILGISPIRLCISGWSSRDAYASAGAPTGRPMVWIWGTNRLHPASWVNFGQKIKQLPSWYFFTSSCCYLK